MAKADKDELMAFRIGVAKDGRRIFFQFTNQDDGAAIEVELSFQAAKFFCSELAEAIDKAEKKPRQDGNLLKRLCWN